MAKRQTAYVLRCQTPKTRRTACKDDIGDDQLIKHSDDETGLTRPIYRAPVMIPWRAIWCYKGNSDIAPNAFLRVRVLPLDVSVFISRQVSPQ